MKISLLLRLASAGFCVLGSFASAQTADEISFAKSVLIPLQAKSFANNTEYCGFFAYDGTGAMVHSRIIQGDAASCYSKPPKDRSWTTFASFHTHGAYLEGYYNELPSTNDIETDMADEIGGYIATPGGRLWYVDGMTGTVKLLCGLECLPQDDNFVIGSDGKILEFYTLKDIYKRTE